MTNWRAVYTKPRSEKRVADELYEMGIEVYCPLVVTVKQWSDRKKKVKEPLFRSYVFVNIAEADIRDVYHCRNVIGYVNWLGKPAVIQDKEISAIKDFLSEVSLNETKTLEFEHLQNVRIHNGPLSGKEGKYLYKKGNKVVLELESMGLMVKAELHHSFIA
jgi:transcription antitermination factor NusG